MPDRHEIINNTIAEMRRLNARIARLEAALARIAENDPDSWEAAIARAALAEPPDA
jgi:hypothetical protein